MKLKTAKTLYLCMKLEDYQYWLNLAYKFSRKQNEAEDLLQDALLIASQMNRADLENEENRKWLTGVIKNRALMDARSGSRRKEREVNSTNYHTSEINPDQIELNQRIISSFPRSSQKVIKLILAGLNQAEICLLLDISAPAFRQRLTSVRKSIKKLPEDLQSEAIAMAYYKRENPHDDLAIGLIRRALLRSMQSEGLGSHDPDGHLIIIRKD